LCWVRIAPHRLYARSVGNLRRIRLTWQPKASMRGEGREFQQVKVEVTLLFLTYVSHALSILYIYIFFFKL
jgi:hypothetical protein